MKHWLLLGIIIVLISLSVSALPYNDTLTNDNGIIITSDYQNTGGVDSFEVNLEIENVSGQDLGDIVIGVFVNPSSRNYVGLKNVEELTYVNSPIRIPQIDSNNLTSTDDFVLCSDLPRGCINPIPTRFNGSLVFAGGRVRTPRTDRGEQCYVLVGDLTNCWFYQVRWGWTPQDNWVLLYDNVNYKLTDRQFGQSYEDFVFLKSIYNIVVLDGMSTKLRLKFNSQLFKSGELTYVAKSRNNPSINSILHPWWNASYSYSKQISVGATHSRIDGNYTYTLTLDTSTLVAAGKLQSDCDDFRIVLNDATDLDRNVSFCNTASTSVNWRSQAQLADGVADSTSYKLYYGNPSATNPLRDLNKVMMFYDTFDDNVFNWPYQNEATETAGYLNIRESVGSGVSGANLPVWIDENTFLEARVIFNSNIEGGYIGTQDSNATTTALGASNGAVYNFIGFSATGVADSYVNNNLGTSTIVYGTTDWNVLTFDFNGVGGSLFYQSINGQRITGNLKRQSALKPTPATIHPFFQIFCDVGGCGTGVYDLNIDYVLVRHYAGIEPTLSLGTETFQIDITIYPDTNQVSFGGNQISVIPLNPNLAINSVRVDLNRTGTPSGATINASYWSIDDVNASSGVDINYFTTYSSVGLHKGCLNLFFSVGASNFNQSVCKNFKIGRVPQDVNFTQIPIDVNLNSDVNFFAQGTDENTGLKYFWQDNGTYFSDSNVLKGDVNRNFSVGGIHNIVLTLTDSDDLNTSKLYSIPIVGHAYFQFYDENFGNAVVPTLLTINGVNYVSQVDSNGLLKIDFNSSFSTNTYTITAGRANYGTRSWVLDLNVNKIIDYNFAMLQSSKGQDINFQFYDWNKVALPNTRISIGAPQSNNKSGLDRNFFAGICETDSDSKCQFFLNGNDLNYTLRALTDAGKVWDYNYTRVSVKIPKDERTFANLSTFRVDVGIIGARTFTNQSADVNFNILPNTLDYYDVKIDFNTSYLAKHFFTRTQGNPVDYIIQPYLVDSAYGISSKFFVIDVATQTTIPNVEIITYKTIPAIAGSNLILMEDILSDGSGTTNASFIAGDTYQSDFYFNRALIFSGTITANSTTYYARLDFGTGISEPNYLPLDVNFNSLGYDTFVEADSNGIISLTQQVIGTYDLLNIKIINNASIVWDVNHSSGTQFTESFDANSVNLNYPIEITYTIWQAGSSRQWNKSYNVVGINANQYTLVGDLQAMKGEVLGDSGAMILALILAMVGVAMAASYVGFDTNFLAIIGFIILGFFWYVSWIPTLWFAVACLMGVGAMVLKARL